jgi:hypothetical protein
MAARQPFSKFQGTGGSRTPGEPVTTLRGARVDVDARRVTRLVAGACLMALAAAVIVLFVAGVQKNAQLTRLRNQGVPVEVTVSGCLGLMGGSGSNSAGYDCTGAFTLAGHRYHEAIPGSALYSPGTRIRAVAVPQDPALLATPRALVTQHASGRVFLLPAVLLALLGLSSATLVLKRGNLRRASTQIP